MLYSDYHVHVMGHVPYVGFATYRCATVRTRFTFYIYIKKKKKKKKKKRVVIVNLGRLGGFCVGNLYFLHVLDKIVNG
jgi:hypothetical protein